MSRRLVGCAQIPGMCGSGRARPPLKTRLSPGKSSKRRKWRIAKGLSYIARILAGVRCPIQTLSEIRPVPKSNPRNPRKAQRMSLKHPDNWHAHQIRGLCRLVDVLVRSLVCVLRCGQPKSTGSAGTRQRELNSCASLQT